MSRFIIQSATALALLASTALPTAAQEANVRLVVLSDLHSAYERTAQLLSAVEAEVEASAEPAAILINGDTFEVGNVVAVRSQTEIDWALLERFAALAPTVLNIGNHEPDIDTDLADVVARAEAIGITVVSNIIDSRTGEPYAPASTVLDLNGTSITIVGIATDALNTYPAATREIVDISAPAQWASENLDALLTGESLPVVLSHAGIAADRDIIPLLPEGTLLVGGHDHATLDYDEAGVRYVHTGSWSDLVTVVELGASGVETVERIAIDATAQGDTDIAAMIAEALEIHLTEEERAVVATSTQALSLADTGRLVAAALAEAAGGDVGFIGHTTFGAGLPEGDVTRYQFDSIVRFDGDLVAAEVDRAVLEDILSRVNQDRDLPLAELSGDFLYAAPTDLADQETYILVTNGWSAMNQENYFGRSDLDFEPVPDLAVKSVVLEALQ